MRLITNRHDGEYLNFVSLQEVHLILGILVSGVNLNGMLSEFARSIIYYRNHALWVFRPYRYAFPGPIYRLSIIHFQNFVSITCQSSN